MATDSGGGWGVSVNDASAQEVSNSWSFGSLTFGSAGSGSHDELPTGIPVVAPASSYGQYAIAAAIVVGVLLFLRKK